MIALCQPHHSQADAGAFTTAQLREMKRPRPAGVRRGVFNWKRESTTVRIGGGSFFSVETRFFAS
ncbi:hypothetical protein ACVILL_000264 [Bradyrhizobium sp. USDA 3364]